MNDGVQIFVGPAKDENGKTLLVVGFHNAFFSQCVNLPYTGPDDARKLVSLFTEGIEQAITQIEATNAVPDSEKRQ